jgi:hypothetical protein
MSVNLYFLDIDLFPGYPISNFLILIYFQVRYLFLNRAGLYKHPSAKAMGTSKSAFPLICDVTGGSDEEFIANVSSISGTIHGEGEICKAFELFICRLTIPFSNFPDFKMP